jgi:hypothetical protein
MESTIIVGDIEQQVLFQNNQSKPEILFIHIFEIIMILKKYKPFYQRKCKTSV